MSAFSKHSFFLRIQFLGDSVAVLLGFLSAFWPHFVSPLQHLTTVQDLPQLYDYVGRIFLGWFIFMGLLLYFNLYSWRNLISLQRAALIVLKTTFYWLVIILSLSVIIKLSPSLSRMFSFCCCLPFRHL